MEAIVTSLDKRIENIINLLPRNGDFKKRNIDQITHISVHHSASPMGKFNAYDFARWHIDPKGRLKAPAICYHFGIEPDGTIQQTNTLDQIAWHTIGANTVAIGIELNGNFEIEEPTQEQLDSLFWLIDYLKKDVLKKDLIVKPHKEFKGNATACCGKNLINKLNK